VRCRGSALRLGCWRGRESAAARLSSHDPDVVSFVEHSIAWILALPQPIGHHADAACSNSRLQACSTIISNSFHSFMTCTGARSLMRRLEEVRCHMWYGRHAFYDSGPGVLSGLLLHPARVLIVPMRSQATITTPDSKPLSLHGHSERTFLKSVWSSQRAFTSMMKHSTTLLLRAT